MNLANLRRGLWFVLAVLLAPLTVLGWWLGEETAGWSREECIKTAGLHALALLCWLCVALFAGLAVARL